MQGFKIFTTVMLGMLIMTMLCVIAKHNKDREAAIASGIITAIQIMAIVSIWL